MASTTLSLNKLIDYTEGSSFVVNDLADGSTKTFYAVFNHLGCDINVTKFTPKIGSVKVGGQNWLSTEKIKITYTIGSFVSSVVTMFDHSGTDPEVSESEGTTSSSATMQVTSGMSLGYNTSRLIVVRIKVESTQKLVGCKVQMSNFTMGIDYEFNHNYTTETARTPSTCCTKGSVTKKCSCGATQTTELALDPNNHSGGTEVRNAKAATCSAEGYTGDTYCKGCGAKLSSGSTIAKKAHTEVTIPAVPATCTTTGLTEGKKCSVCGVITVAQTTIPAKGHTAGAAVVENKIEATCTVDGSYDEVVYCSVCGTELSRNKKTISAKGHSYTTQTFEPTETSPGYTRYTCSECGHSYDVDFTYRLKMTVENCTVEGVVDGGIYAKNSKVNFTIIANEGYEYSTAIAYYPSGETRTFPLNTGRLEFKDNITFVVTCKPKLPEITSVTITRSSDLAQVTISTPVDAESKYIISVEVK